MQRAQGGSLFGSALIEGGCNAAGGIAWAWRASDGEGFDVALDATAGASAPTLQIAASLLTAGGGASVTLTICFSALLPAAELCGSASFSFAVALSPLHASLAGGGGVVGDTAHVNFDASASADPDGLGGALSFSWACVAADGVSACLSASGAPLQLQPGAAKQQLRFLGSQAGRGYTVSVSVSKDGRAASASSSLLVMAGSRPLVTLAGLSAPAVLAQQSLTLLGRVNSSAATLTTIWSQTSGPPLALTSTAVVATPLSSTSLVLHPNALQPGATYVLRLSANDADGDAHAEITLAVAAAPAGGRLAVWPTTGTALETRFQLSTDGWAVVGGGSLLYSFSYSAYPGAASVLLTGYQPSSSVNVTLPAGTLQLSVSCASAAGALSAESPTASAAVAFRSFSAPAALSTYVAGVAGQAAAELASGDSSSALQLVGGLAALLEQAAPPPPLPPQYPAPPGARPASPPPAAPSAANAAAAASRSAQRDNLLSLVANASSSAPPTATSVAATVQLVQRLVAASPAAELSPAAQATALSIVAAAAAGGTLLTSGTQLNIAAALSSVASAALHGGAAADAYAAAELTTLSADVGSGRANMQLDLSLRAAALAQSCSVLSGVLSVLDSLTGAQRAALTVPGQAAVTLSTATLSTYVALDDWTQPGSRLFTAATSAPGAAASVAPLPSAAMQAFPAGSSVAVAFYSLSFDPYTCGGAANTSAVTRMALSASAAAAGWSPLQLAQLSQPILMSLPTPAAASPTDVLHCVWWDPQLGRYDTEGCVSLPNPAPPNATLSWLDGASPPAWAAAGPLFDNCTEAFLDCASAPAGAFSPLPPALLRSTDSRRGAPSSGAALFPDPSSPAVPGVACAPGSTRLLRVFSGVDCAAWAPPADDGCGWSAAEQAFVGGGCLLSPLLSVASTHLTDFAAAHAPRVAVAVTVWPPTPPAPPAPPPPLPAPAAAQSPAPSPPPPPPFPPAPAAAAEPQSLSQSLRARALRAMRSGPGSATLAATIPLLLPLLAYLCLDSPAASRALAQLKTRRLGFQSAPGGAWLWRLGDGGVAAPPGSAVADPGPLAELAQLARLPLARLRMALPEELIDGSLAAALGKRLGGGGPAPRSSTLLPRRATAPAAAEPPPAVNPVRVRPRRRSSGHGPSSPTLPSSPAPPASPASPAPRASICARLPWQPRGSCSFDDAEAAAAGAQAAADTLPSTALVLALCRSRHLLPAARLARAEARAEAHFRPHAGALDWLDLSRKFDGLLVPSGGLFAPDWLPAARLWRLALLQERDGSWPACGGLSLALCAGDGGDGPGADALGGGMAAALLAALPACLSALRDAPAPAQTLHSRAQALLAEAAAEDATRAQALLAEAAAAEAAELLRAPPLAEAAAAGAGALALPAPAPRRAGHARSWSDGGPVFTDTERVWATALACAACDRLPLAYLAQPASAALPAGLSAAELGCQWLAGAAARDARLTAALPAVAAAAAAALSSWEAAAAQRLAPLRRAQPRCAPMAPPPPPRPAWQRAAGALAAAAAALAAALALLARRAAACPPASAAAGIVCPAFPGVGARPQLLAAALAALAGAAARAALDALWAAAEAAECSLAPRAPPAGKGKKGAAAATLPRAPPLTALFSALLEAAAEARASRRIASALQPDAPPHLAAVAAAAARASRRAAAASLLAPALALALWAALAAAAVALREQLPDVPRLWLMALALCAAGEAAAAAARAAAAAAARLARRGSDSAWLSARLDAVAARAVAPPPTIGRGSRVAPEEAGGAAAAQAPQRSRWTLRGSRVGVQQNNPLFIEESGAAAPALAQRRHSGGA